MTKQDLKECIAEVKNSDIPNPSKKKIMNVLYERMHKGVWIPCSERLPKEHDSMFSKLKGTDKWNNAMFEKISDEVNVTVEFEDGQRTTKTLHTIDGKWSGGDRGVQFKVIAWQPLPESYNEK